MNPWDNVCRRHARETLRAWRAREVKAAAGVLADLRRRLAKRLNWYQRDKPTRKENESEA